MIIPEQKQHSASFTPNIQLCVYIIFAIGVAATCGLVVGAIIAVSYLINLAMTVLVESVAHISQLYTTSDSFTKLLILCIIGYCLLKLAIRAYKSFKK